MVLIHLKKKIPRKGVESVWETDRIGETTRGMVGSGGAESEKN